MTSLFRGVHQIWLCLTRGGGGVKNPQKRPDVIYGRPLIQKYDDIHRYPNYKHNTHKSERVILFNQLWWHYYTIYHKKLVGSSYTIKKCVRIGSELVRYISRESRNVKTLLALLALRKYNIFCLKCFCRCML